jgi:hypothetical protein
MTEEQLKAMPMVTAGLCSKGCGLAFTHAPAKVAHEKVCKGGTNTATAAALAAAARSPSPTSPATGKAITYETRLLLLGHLGLRDDV